MLSDGIAVLEKTSLSQEAQRLQSSEIYSANGSIIIRFLNVAKYPLRALDTIARQNPSLAEGVVVGIGTCNYAPQ